MQVGYGCVGKRRPAVWKYTAIVLGLTAAPMTLKLEQLSTPIQKASISTLPVTTATLPAAPDPRTQRLRRFMASLHCPVSNLAEDFINAADDNHLDWRLLPSISIIESGGGKAYKNNNIFGWANGDYLFPTVRTAIHQVAFKLGKSSLYRNRDVEAKLHLYNPDEQYARNVMAVMNRISPVTELRPASQTGRSSTPFLYSSD